MALAPGFISIAAGMGPGRLVLWSRSSLIRMPHEHQRSFEPVVYLELVKDIGQVSLDRFLADEDFFADFFVGKPFGYEL